MSPSRTRAKWRHGVPVNGRPIRPDLPDLGTWLANHGNYESVYAGKWHLKPSYTDNIPGFRVLHTGIGGLGTVCDTAVSMSCASYILNRPKKARPFFMVTSSPRIAIVPSWIVSMSSRTRL